MVNGKGNNSTEENIFDRILNGDFDKKDDKSKLGQKLELQGSPSIFEKILSDEDYKK